VSTPSTTTVVGTGRVIGQLGRRSILRMIRQPQAVIPSLFFPLMFTALNVASFGRAASLPGFGADSFLDFAVAGAVVQGVMFGSTAAGIDMALDVEGGFLDRLSTAPIPRWAVLAGRLLGPAAFGAAQALLFCVILVAFGANIAGGVAGVAVLVVVASLLAVALGALFIAVALRTGSSEAVQAMFPIVFISLFVSTAMFPGALMTAWFKTVALANPVSTMVGGLRHQVLVGFDLGQALRAVSVVLAALVVSSTLASLALRRRVVTA